MKDKDLLVKAIDNYDPLTPAHRKVLKVLVDLAVDEVALITVIKLCKISTLSRTLIYQALEVLEKQEFIEVIKTDKNVNKSKLNSITLRPDGLESIVKYYELEQRASAKYTSE